MDKETEDRFVSMLMDNGMIRHCIASRDQLKKDYESHEMIHDFICKYRDSDTADNLIKGFEVLERIPYKLNFELWFGLSAAKLERWQRWITEYDDQITGHYYASRQLRKEMQPYTGINIKQTQLTQAKLF